MPGYKRTSSSRSTSMYKREAQRRSAMPSKLTRAQAERKVQRAAGKSKLSRGK